MTEPAPWRNVRHERKREQEQYSFKKELPMVTTCKIFLVNVKLSTRFTIVVFVDTKVALDTMPGDTSKPVVWRRFYLKRVIKR